MSFGNTTAGEKAALSSDITFDALLDETCERLLHRQVKYAIQRIQEMEQRLGNLERELDDFLSANKKRKARKTN
jgi:hypothetical protein